MGGRAVKLGLERNSPDGRLDSTCSSILHLCFRFQAEVRLNAARFVFYAGLKVRGCGIRFRTDQSRPNKCRIEDRLQEDLPCFHRVKNP